MLTETIEQIESGTSLTQEEMADTIDLIMQGVCAEDDIRAFVETAKTSEVKHIVLLSGRGEKGAQRAVQPEVRSGHLR